MSRTFRVGAAGLLLCCAASVPAPAIADDFAIRDGDTVVFLGDSITAARTYGKLIEQYTLLRFPKRRVRFINAGKGGDTAAGGLARLETDVFARGATLLTVAYGVNDIGWGFKADEQHKQRYLEAIEGIVRQCRERDVRVYICSAAVTGADPFKSEQDFLQTMCDAGMEIAKQHGGQAIDVQRTMREIQQRVWQANERVDSGTDKASLHADDGVHLNALGQTAMAYAILKGLGAPADVSSVSIDARGGRLLESSGCQVSDVTGSEARLEFTRLDEGLPLNGETFFALNFRFVPIPSELNRYMLRVTGLPEGRYDVTADGRGVSTYSAKELADGVNIASATTNGWLPGGPWDAQANVLHLLSESRNQLDLSGLHAKAHLPEQDVTRDLLQKAQAANAQLEEMQRLIAAPRPYRFVIERAADKAD